MYSLHKYFYLRSLMRIFPDAKVVLTVRDPEKWYTSVKQTIYKTRTFLDGPIGFVVWLFGGYNVVSLACQSANQEHPVNKLGISNFLLQNV